MSLRYTLPGILARALPSDERDLADQSISKITIVVCNLYPFSATISKPGCTLADAVEEIDIGGVTLLRAAAKNHGRVCVLSDPADYDAFLNAWINGDVSQALRNRLALKAFEMTAKYDDAISGYFREQYASSPESQPLQRMVLRYGANPHQKPAQAFVAEGELPFKGVWLAFLPGSQYTSHVRRCSFMWFAWVHQSPGCAQLVCVGKGTPGGTGPPCGCFVQACFPRWCCSGYRAGRDRETGLWSRRPERASYGTRLCIRPSTRSVSQTEKNTGLTMCDVGADRMSSFGDFISLSAPCDLATAKIISREVSDGVIAPGYSPEALDVLKKKKAGKYCVLEVISPLHLYPIERY